MENMTLSATYDIPNTSAYQDLPEISAINGLQAMEEKLVAAARTAKELLVAREQALEQKLSKAEQFVDTRLKDIQTIINRFQTIAREADAQAWRTKAEAVYKEGKEQAESMQHLHTDLQKSLKDSCTRIQQASGQIVKGMSKALGNLHPHMFQQLIENSNDTVKDIATEAKGRMNHITKWFHWKNLAIVFFLSLLVTSAVGLYANAEWPWEAHDAVVKQRHAGQALIDIWNQLSQNDQQLIINDLEKPTV